jgi:predicted O-methyltransferase YrrM
MSILKRQAQKVWARVSRHAGFIHEARTNDMRADDEFRQVYADCRDYTMTSMSRMYALHQAVRHVLDRGVPGDLVECGVWRGGSSMVMAKALAAAGDADRRLYLYDTYEGMSEPTDRDRDPGGRSAEDLLRTHDKDDPIWAEASLEEVRHNLSTCGLDPDRVEFVKGKVEDTIPATLPSKIALLRLDTDWYESTRHELEHMFPLLVPGGVLIIDDYGHWQGARTAVDEYFAEHRPDMLLNRIDYTGRIGVKLPGA